MSGLNSSACTVSEHTDWTVTMEWSDNNHSFSATSGIGMPFLYFNKASSDVAQIEINTGTVTVENEMILITNGHNGANFAVYGPKGSAWTKSGNLYTSSLNNKNYWSMVFLPQEAPDAYTTAIEYKKHAYVFPINTTTTWSYDENSSKLTTVFNVEVEIKEGTDSKIIQGLLPHQWNNLASESLAPEGHSYPTVRGELKSLIGNSFTVQSTFYGILPTLPYVDNYSEGFSQIDLNEKIQLLENDGLATWTDSYNQGQEMNRLIQTARIADLSGQTVTRDKIINTVKTRLEDWLRAETNEVAFLFYYDSTWSTMIGYPAGHGQDGNINDHHFHWGYFIHAAAFVEQYEPGWANSWGEMIDHLIRDAANLNRFDDQYPFLRNFSPYAGHCWANGFATFPQGNDQESTSESMQFNSSLIHWGSITNNKEIRDLGIYLYTTEQTAIEEYWFDVYNRNFSATHPYSLVSRVWGNSYDNGTFWTSDIEASYGIELYPIHGGSLYLGHNTDYVRQLWNEIERNTGILNNDSNPNLWHDVMWEYLAFIDPAQAIDLYNSYPDRELKFGISDAQTYHWLHAMNALGKVDISITADYPIAAAFNNGQQITYVAHNYGNEDIDVLFSDGNILSVPARTMRTSRDLALSGELLALFPRAYKDGSTELSVEINMGTPDSIVFYLNDEIRIGSSTEQPYSLNTPNLPLGNNQFYARLYLDGQYVVTNLVTVQVGDQIPYSLIPFNIPGTFQAGQFDIFEGGVGQGISYQDITKSNLGDHRAVEYVDVFLDPQEGESVGWISPGEWVEYTVNVAESGIYQLEFRYACGNPNGGGPFTIFSDGIAIASDISLGYTGGWADWETKRIELPLKSGLQILRLYFDNGEFNIAELQFSYLESLPYSQPVANAGADILHVLPAQNNTLDGSQSFDPEGLDLNFEWTQLYGPSILNFSDLNEPETTISNLTEGVYLLRLKVDNNEFEDHDHLLLVSSFDSNFPPNIDIVSPEDKASFLEGSNIIINALASDIGGEVNEVEFFVDGQSIGVITMAPYTINWPVENEGNYDITAVVTDNEGNKTTSSIISILIRKAPSIEGTWKMLSEPNTLGVGPNIGNIEWWNCDAACISERSCFFDDKFIFEPDGSFSLDLGAETWVESWQDGSTEGCRPPVTPHDASGSYTWSLEGNLLTLSGVGAYLGLPKVNNNGELSSPSEAPQSITYPIHLNETGDKMMIDIDFGGGYWHYELVKDFSTNTNDLTESQLILYPNPVNLTLYIELPFSNSFIEIYDINGRSMTKMEVNARSLILDTATWPSGIYILKSMSNEHSETHKIIKQ